MLYYILFYTLLYLFAVRSHSGSHDLLCVPFFLTRQNGMGYTNLMSRLGVCISPLILVLEDVWTLLPQIIICTVAIISGLVSLLLPETLNVRLPETIDDIEKPRFVT